MYWPQLFCIITEDIEEVLDFIKRNVLEVHWIREQRMSSRRNAYAVCSSEEVPAFGPVQPSRKLAAYPKECRDDGTTSEDVLNML